MSAEQDLIDEAYAVVKARIERKKGSMADRAVLHMLGASALSLAESGPWNSDHIEGAHRVQMNVARNILRGEQVSARCERCHAPFGLHYECDTVGCVERDDDQPSG